MIMLWLVLLLTFCAAHARDGAPDLNFGTDGVVVHDLPILPLTAQVQPDGRLLIAGGSRPPLPVNTGVIVRLLPDGQIDTDFGDDGVAVLPNLPSLDLDELEWVHFTGLHVFDDGRILAVGSIGAFQGAGSIPERRCPLLAIFNASGNLDTDFGGEGAVCVGDSTAAMPTQGTILRAPPFVVSESSIFVGDVWSLSIATFESFLPKRLYKVLLDGTLDVTFGASGMVEFDASSPVAVFAVAEDSAGRVLAGMPLAVARLDTTGTVDATYGDSGISELVLPKGWGLFNIYGSSLRPDGRLDIVSDVFDFENSPDTRTFALSRRLENGTLDASLPMGDWHPTPPGLVAWASSYGDEPPDEFNLAGMLETRMLMQPDGRTVLLGREFLRLDTDGSRDCGFGQGGFADAGWSEYAAQALAFGPDNRLWVARHEVLAQPGDPEHVTEVRKFIAESVFSDGFRDRVCER